MADAVAEAVRVVRESGLPNETNAMFTLVEGESGGIDVAQHRESAYDLSSGGDSSRGRMGATINGQGNT